MRLYVVIAEDGKVPLMVFFATEDEAIAHKQFLDHIDLRGRCKPEVKPCDVDVETPSEIAQLLTRVYRHDI